MVPSLDRPCQIDGAGGLGKRAVLRRVGRQLVDHQPEGRRLLGRQDDGRPLDAQPAGLLRRVRRQLPPRPLAEVGAAPIRVAEQGMGAGQRRDAAVEAIDEILSRAASQRLLRDRLDHGQRVLDTVGELAQQEALLLLPPP